MPCTPEVKQNENASTEDPQQLKIAKLPETG
jgi:hypothetical protein